MPPDQRQDGLEAMITRVLDETVYMVLGTADPEGRPWTSPVFFAPDGHRDLYWVSSPEVTHSRNLAERPELSIVVFDSRAAVGTGGESAVYMAGTAAEVAPDDLDRTLSTFTGAFTARGAREFVAAELRPPAHLRLYRATVAHHYVLCPLEAGQPCVEHGRRGDHRLEVHLPPA